MDKEMEAEVKSVICGWKLEEPIHNVLHSRFLLPQRGESSRWWLLSQSRSSSEDSTQHFPSLIVMDMKRKQKIHLQL